MMKISVTPKQYQFISSDCDEVLFGGAAGGGKSYAQIIDSLIFATRYPKSSQLMLRRTLPELNRSLIMTSLEVFPKEIATFYKSEHLWRFKNGSVIEFGYCDSETDVTKYQSAQYDVIRFDELTHFTKFQYLYLISRNRGANDFPKQIKSTTNPGGEGHSWVKKRFIDSTPSLEKNVDKNGRSQIFIPALISDNLFMMSKDPNYVKRLAVLPESQKKALLDGVWDIFEGQYFDCFDRNIHVIKPFVIPPHWRRYISIDYGLDMLACYWCAFDSMGCGIIYRELYQSGLLASTAAKKILQMTPLNEKIYLNFAPPDLWGRGSDTGKSIAEIFLENGIMLTRVSAARESGWLNMKEWLTPFVDERGEMSARLKIFDNCFNLIRTLPSLCIDKVNSNDIANNPHELTHAPDAIRYLLAGRPYGEDKSDIAELEENEPNFNNFIRFGV